MERYKFVELTIAVKSAFVARTAYDAFPRSLSLTKPGLNSHEPAILLCSGLGLKLMSLAMKLKAEIVEAALLDVTHIRLLSSKFYVDTSMA